MVIKRKTFDGFGLGDVAEYERAMNVGLSNDVFGSEY